MKCESCKRHISEAEMSADIVKDGKTVRLCEKCFRTGIKSGIIARSEPDDIHLTEEVLLKLLEEAEKKI